MTADLGFLIKLDARIWRVQNEGQRSSNRGIGQYYLEADKEFITKEEWATIKELIAAHSLICVPGAGVFGFGRSLALYTQPNDAPFPGTESAFNPEYMLSFTNKHMEKVLGSKADYDGWWKEMDPLVYNKKNEGLIKKFMKEPLREKSYYEY